MADLESVISGAVESAGLSSGADNVVEASDGVTTDLGTGDLLPHNDEEVGSVASTSVEAPPATGEEVVEGTDTPAATPVEGVPAEDAFAKEHGLTPTKPGQRENRIPYSRVKKIAENAEAKVAEAILGAKPAADKPILEQVQARVASFNDLSTKVQTYEKRLESVDFAERLMLENPEQFLEILPQVNPRFAELLTARRAAEPTTGAAATVTGDDPRPEPDIEMPNGQKTYSLEGLEARLAWERRQAAKDALAQVDPVLKPIKERAEAEKRINAAAAKTVSQVKHAEDHWPGFKENADEILKTLQEDKPGKLSLMDAYVLVRDRKHAEQIAALTTDHNKVRASVIAELKKTPTSTSTGPSATGVVKSTPKPGTRSLETVIAESVARARRG